MAVTSTTPTGDEAAKARLLYRPEVRQLIYQVVLVAAIVLFFYTIVTNAAENMRRLNIASGLGFWDRTSGFEIGRAHG